MDTNYRKHVIIHWNCQGLRARREEIKLLLTKYNPIVLCLQETRLTPDIDSRQTFRGYQTYYKSNPSNQGGVGLLIKNSAIHSCLDLDTVLEAKAARVTINNKCYSICSLYIPPTHNLKVQDFNALINKLPRPFLLLGDYNSHNNALWGSSIQNPNIAWGSATINDKGKIIESAIEEHDLAILNTEIPTRFDSRFGTYSLLDLSLCHPSIFMDFNISVNDDNHSSDHFPVHLECTEGDPNGERMPKWYFKRANWDKFQDLCIKNITGELGDGQDDKMSTFSSELLDIAYDTIPRTSATPKKSKPWFDAECKASIKTRNKAARQCRAFPNASNKMRFRLLKASTRKLFKQKKRTSWQQ